MLDFNEILIHILVEFLCIRILIFSFNFISYIIYIMLEIDNGVILILCLYFIMIILCLIELCVSNCDADENPYN